MDSLTTLTVPRGRIHYGEAGYFAEASDLGIAPGYWPTAIAVRWDSGQVFQFQFELAQTRDGDITAVHYQNGRDSLLVWND